MNESTPSSQTAYGIVLTEKIRSDLLSFGKLNWSTHEIAAYFNWNEEALRKERADPNSEISKILERGYLQGRAEIEVRLLTSATGGNLTAIKDFSNLMRDRSSAISKMDIFGGWEDEGAFERVEKYIADGSVGSLSRSDQAYIDMLLFVYSLDARFGKRRTIQFLTRKPVSLSYQRAADVYAEAVEMFFANRKISKDALRAKAADQYDNLYHLAVEAAKTAKDYEAAAAILERKTKILQLDKEDPVVLPGEQLDKRIRLLSLTPEVIGLPEANRDAMAAQIDNLVESDSVKKRLRIDAGIEDVDIEEYLENVIQEES